MQFLHQFFIKSQAQLSKAIQGVFTDDYSAGIGLLSNKDSYQYNLIYTPGLTLQNASSTVATVISNTQDRGDAIAVVYTVAYNTTNKNTVINFASSICIPSSNG
jgi:hypothetical protein